MTTGAYSFMLRHGLLVIDCAAATVHVRFGEYACPGTREPSSANVAQAEEQGYRGSAAAICWRSLVEHELLHMLWADVVLGVASPTLQFEAGMPLKVPYYDRLYEEAIIVGLQRHRTTGERPRSTHALRADQLRQIMTMFHCCLSDGIAAQIDGAA